MSKQEQVNCGKFIEEYLQKRNNIKLVILILDIRHTPTADDKLMYDYLIKSGISFIAIGNKADKIAITKVDNQIEEIRNYLNPMKDVCFLPFSSERKIYTEAIWKKLKEYLTF